MATRPKVTRVDNGVYDIIDPNPENHTVDHEDLYIYASLKAKTKGRTFLTEDNTSNNNDEIDTIEISTVDLVISDSATRGENKRQFLTTNWTEIGGSQFTDVNNRGDVEGFGITNVDIKVEGSYIPVVTIDFVDIRGATLFEQGSCSPYGLFFHLPYPVFELTVKGYYGKPVTYYLNLIKFNTKFNSETGNFEARGEFIGWSYAFLADILMGFVRCANYMTDGWDAQKKLKTRYDEAVKYYITNGLYDESDYLTEDMSESVLIEGNDKYLQPFCWRTQGGSTRCMTITDLLKRIESVEEFLGRVKTDEQYTQITNLIRVSNQLISMRTELQNFNRKILSDEYKGYLKGLPQNSEAPNVTENTKFIFNGPPDEKLKGLLKDFLQRPIEGVGAGYGTIVAQIPLIKEVLVTGENEIPQIYGGTYVGVGSQTKVSQPDGLASKISVSEDPESFEMLSGLDEVYFQNGMMNSGIIDGDGDQLFNYDDVGGSEYFIDTGYISSIIKKDLDIINSELEKRRVSVKEEIDAGVVKKLGFRPTIRNVFTILSCNVENFIQLLLDCSIKAEEYHSQRKSDYNRNFSSGDRRLNEVRNSSDDTTTGQNVYPWPTYYETNYTNNTSYSTNKPQTKEVYPGEKTDFYDWWEVRFVEDFIKACEKVNKEDESLLEEKSGLPGFDNYTPINPLESKIVDADVQLKYREAVTSSEESGVTSAVNKFIAERMFITMDFSYYDPIRLNLLNFGLGHNIPKRLAAEKDESQDLSEFNKQRLWFHTLYSSGNEEGSTIVENIAKIDANNLLSTIDDATILNKLNLEISTGDLKGNIESTLKNITNNITETNGSESWFKTGVDYTDIFERFNDPSPSYKDTLKSVIDENLGTVNKFRGKNKYWAYHPKGGYIRFLGRGSKSYADETGNNAVLIHTDIRKMKEDYLFRLIDEAEIENLPFTINYNGDNEESNKKLNGELSKTVLDKVKTFQSSSKYVNYSTNDKTKLLQFDGENDDGKGLFTTLNIGVSGYDSSEGKIGSEQEKYSIKYAGIPTFVTNSDINISGQYVSGYGNYSESSNFLFMQQTYQAFGRLGETTRFAPSSPNETKSVPVGFTLEIPGKGIFKNVDVYESDGGQQLSKYDEDEPTENIQSKVDQAPFSGTAYSLLPPNNGDIGKKYVEWGSTFTADNLIQLPIWLDNVNKFRESTTVERDARGLSNLTDLMWGSIRPLTTSNHELNSPQIGQVIRTYGNNRKRANGSSDTTLAYNSEQIQNRNLAYLFLASCKPTPLITCGLAEPDPGTFNGGPAVFTFKDEHYPKSIIPFITSQGLVKIPKVWVYGIGSVLWRWKMYMGCNTDSNGNILWRHPIFGEEPIGLDPLAQPGHPGYTENDLFRGERSNSISNTTENSYVNKLFNEEKGWFSSDVNNQNHIQTSCFASTTIRNIGENRSLSGGRLNSGAKYGSPSYYRISHGCNFDYWGTYNGDDMLIQNGIPNSVLMPKRSNIFYGYLGSSRSSWVTLRFHFIQPSPAKGVISDEFIANWSDNYPDTDNPLDLGFRCAKEAASNTFWPLLWITPWQHFYTEPISSTGSVGPKLPSRNQKDNSIVEKTLTFIPLDHKFRDYVGNFGALGDKTRNYANRTLKNATTGQTTFTITNEFSLPNKNNGFSDKTINVSYVTYEGFGLNTWVNLEGGRYAELITLLPTFIKEKFVEEFEKWVDTEWSSNYLEVVDPVNFDGDCKKDCLAKSYRVNSFNDGGEYTFNKILGQRSSEIYLGPWNRLVGEDPGVGVVSLNTDTDTDNSNKITQLETNLFNQYYYAMVATPRVFGLDWHDYQEGTPFYANETLVEKYLEAFQKEWNDRYKQTRESIQKDNENANNDTILDDSDIKLSLYRSFKSITDKWISSTTEAKSATPNYFFNITGNGLNEEKTPLAAHFSYVNRVMGEIGNKSVLDVFKLKEIPNNPKMSFYNLISNLLGENKFDFFPLPTFTNFTGGDYKGNPEKKAEDMFSPYTNMIEPKSGPNFICMYVGGTSRTLDLKPKANCPVDQNDMNYNDDGFSINNSEDKVNIPYEYQNPETPLVTSNVFSNTNNIENNIEKRIENGGITAFKVAYGIENQNMFKSIELDQTEFSETNESLLVIDRLANGGDPSNRTTKGNNLHNVYLTRSYTCKVESLGNMMIQPLQYFDLTNVPMFYGTYIITKVEHNIKPHHITTNFTGVRQPIATVPIVEDISVALNNSIRNIKAIEGGANLGSGGAGGGVIVGENINQNRVTQAYPLYVTSELSVYDSRYGFAGKKLINFTRELEKHLQNKFPNKNIKFSNDNGAGPNVMRSLKATLQGGSGRVKNSKHAAGFAIDLLFEGTFTDNSGNSVSLGNYYNQSDTRKKYTWSQGNIPVAKDHKFMLEVKKFLDTSKWKDIIRWGASFGGDYTGSGRENIPGIGYNNDTVQNDEIHHFEIKDGILQNYIPEEIKKVIERIGLKVPTKQTELTPIYAYPFGGSNPTNTNTDVNDGDGKPDNNNSSQSPVDNIAEFTNQETIPKGSDIARRLQIDLDLSLEQASGIVGNLIKESRLIPDRIQGSGVKKGLITESGGWNGAKFISNENLGYGWAQWTYYTYKNDFIDYANTQRFNLNEKPATDEINYGYLVSWIKSKDKESRLNKLKTKKTVYDAAKYFAQNFEKCAKCQTEEEWKERGDYGQEIYNYSV